MKKEFWHYMEMNEEPKTKKKGNKVYVDRPVEGGRHRDDDMENKNLLTSNNTKFLLGLIRKKSNASNAVINYLQDKNVIFNALQGNGQDDGKVTNDYLRSILDKHESDFVKASISKKPSILRQAIEEIDDDDLKKVVEKIESVKLKHK